MEKPQNLSKAQKMCVNTMQAVVLETAVTCIHNMLYVFTAEEAYEILDNVKKRVKMEVET